MKNSIQMNIGLTRQDGRENSTETVALALKHAGFILTACRIVTSEWQGTPERTLACEVLVSLPLCHAECRLAIGATVKRLATDLCQSCIAVKWPEGHGDLIPPVAPFDGQYWKPVFPSLAREDGAESVGW
jgi:ABC-type uncharacterized transport system YnjBCD permease subunit